MKIVIGEQFTNTGKVFNGTMIKTVLFEQEENEGWVYGFSENYVKVKTPFNPNLINELVEVEFIEIDRDGLMKCLILTNFAS